MKTGISKYKKKIHIFPCRWNLINPFSPLAIIAIIINFLSSLRVLFLSDWKVVALPILACKKVGTDFDDSKKNILVYVYLLLISFRIIFRKKYLRRQKDPIAL
jgi:hypothetical protein